MYSGNLDTIYCDFELWEFGDNSRVKVRSSRMLGCEWFQAGQDRIIGSSRLKWRDDSRVFRFIEF